MCTLEDVLHSMLNRPQPKCVIHPVLTIDMEKYSKPKSWSLLILK